MKLDVHSKTMGKVVFSRLDQSVETGRRNASNSARLCGIDPADLEVVIAADATVSRHLGRYGEEWYVDSDEVRGAAGLLPEPGY